MFVNCLIKEVKETLFCLWFLENALFQDGKFGVLIVTRESLTW